MKIIRTLLMLSLCIMGFCLDGITQSTPTPTPTRVQFMSSCVQDGVNPQTLIRNGDFEVTPFTLGLTPPSWEAGKSGLSGLLRSQPVSDKQENHYVELGPGASLSQIPLIDTTSYGSYQIIFCAVVVNGVVTVSIGGAVRAQYPTTASANVSTGQFRSDIIQINLSTSTDVTNNQVIITYSGSGVAYIDNFQLVQYRTNEQTTPSPTPSTPTPRPTATQKPTDKPTPKQTFTPGPTPTSTPGINADSIQLIANPPMLLVSPDDFIGQQGTKKQVLLNYQIIGTNGQPIDLTKIDPEATIQFTMNTAGAAQDVGTLGQMDSKTGNQTFITTERKKLSDLGGDPVYFIPRKTFEGTVRIVVDIEYEAYVNGKKDKLNLRGVVPIFMSIKKEASLTNPTGTFNASQNFAAGRQAGDRGFRPDMRTNLYFRERLE